jgi:Cu-processing system ATP-binding protein
VRELSCANDDKLSVVRAVTCLGLPVVDLEIIPPSLDEMYAHFLRREAAE